MVSVVMAISIVMVPDLLVSTMMVLLSLVYLTVVMGLEISTLVAIALPRTHECGHSSIGIHGNGVISVDICYSGHSCIGVHSCSIWPRSL